MIICDIFLLSVQIMGLGYSLELPQWGMCTILVNRLQDYACPVNVWLGKLTALDMTPLGWLSRKTSTQKKKKTSMRHFKWVRIIYLPYLFGLFWLCWGLTTRQPLWVILCRLPEKGRKETEEIAEEMKVRDREERGTGMKVKKQKK